MSRMTAFNTWRAAEYKEWCDAGYPVSPEVKYLHLCNAGIESLPYSILNLPNLVHIDLSWNKLYHIPATMWQLTNLAFLDISYNHISRIDSTQLGKPGIDKLSKLRHLYANNNLLRSVPRLIGCPLLILDLSHNLITKFPSAKLVNYSVLNVLRINDNKITSLFSNFKMCLSRTRFSIDESATDQDWFSIEWDTDEYKTVVVPGTNNTVRVYKPL